MPVCYPLLYNLHKCTILLYCQYMTDIISQSCMSSYMSSMVTPCSASSSNHQREGTLLYIVSTNLKFGNRAFSVLRPREWNTLPASVCQSTSVVQFKSRLKTHLFTLYYVA